MYISRLPGTDRKTQVVQEILRYIRTMNLKQDNKLPREEEFCKLIGTSRVTLRAALEELSSQGVVFRRHGKGTFVNVHSMDMKVTFNPVMDFYDMISLSGYEPSVELVCAKEIAAPEFLQEMMGIDAEEKISFSGRVFYADRQFCAYTEDYLRLSVLGTDEALSNRALRLPIFQMLSREFGIQIAWDKVELDTVCSANIRGLPNGICPDKPLLCLKGVDYDTEDRPVLCSMEYINTELIKFNQIRKRYISHFCDTI